jgi:hypothetical protein
MVASRRCAARNARPGSADALVVARCNLDPDLSYKRSTFNFALHRQPDRYRPATERKGAIPPQR